MRKSVIFVIAIIYIVSMVIVTFFGLRTRVDQFTIYFTSISITNYDTIVQDQKYKIVEFDETEGYTSTFITYEYAPKNVSYSDMVKFVLSNNTIKDETGKDIVCAEISSFGELVIYRRKAVTVTIMTTDGSAMQDNIIVICK